MNRKFWSNRNVLITGFWGFLGSNLTKQILNCGAKVAGFDIKVDSVNTILTKDEYKNIKIIKGDIANYKLVKDAIEEHKIEVVFHLAAETVVGRSLKNPLLTFSSNIKGTWNILEICRKAGCVNAIVVASSDKAYGSHKTLPYQEDAALKGEHPYDVSKSCADLICYTFYNTYGVPVCVTRCGNIFGAGDFHFSRIVPNAIRCALSDRPILIRSDGKFTRDYVYVDDIVNGYILLAQNIQRLKLGGEAFNLSCEDPVTVIELIKKVYKLADSKPNYIILNNAKKEIRHQYLSSEKARKILGWAPKYTMEEGLKRTIKWYRTYFSNK